MYCDVFYNKEQYFSPYLKFLSKLPIDGKFYMRNDNRVRIYPEYFDVSLTRAQGRRVSKKLALENPTLGELKLSAQKLHYSVEAEKDAAYPRCWNQPKGLLFVSKPDSETEMVAKTVLLRNLSKTVKEFARPYIAEKLKEERAKAEAQAGKKGKQGTSGPSRHPEKRPAGKPLRRRR